MRNAGLLGRLWLAQYLNIRELCKIGNFFNVILVADEVVEELRKKGMGFSFGFLWDLLAVVI